jgi:hypothetical protein
MCVRYKLHEPARAGRARHNGTALRTFRTRGPRSDDLLARIIVWRIEKKIILVRGRLKGKSTLIIQERSSTSAVVSEVAIVSSVG